MTIPSARVASIKWLLRVPSRATRNPIMKSSFNTHIESRNNLQQQQKNIHTSRVCRHVNIEQEKKKDVKDADPRVSDLGRAIEDDFAMIRDCYATPKNPIVLAHGLFGFSELHLAGRYLPSVQYWRGITDALRSKGISVITTSVPSLGSIEERALALSQEIASKAHGKSVNIIAHSMGGLDARFMISRLQPENVEVLSLTTVATPHRGTSFADWCFEESWWGVYIPGMVRVLNEMGVGTGAFEQLGRKYMGEEFNPKTRDRDDVRYFSYGACCEPKVWSAFRRSHGIVRRAEGENDGLVSVESSRWGTYKGTLVGVSHLDLINWTNRLRWLVWEMTGNTRKFNAIAFYLDIADMLAKEGL